MLAQKSGQVIIPFSWKTGAENHGVGSTRGKLSASRKRTDSKVEKRNARDLYW